MTVEPSSRLTAPRFKSSKPRVPRRREHHVEIAEASRQCPRIGLREHARVGGKRNRLLTAWHTQVCSQFSERGCQPLQVLRVSCRGDVHVFGGKPSRFFFAQEPFDDVSCRLDANIKQRGSDSWWFRFPLRIPRAFRKDLRRSLREDVKRNRFVRRHQFGLKDVFRHHARQDRLVTDPGAAAALDTFTDRGCYRGRPFTFHDPCLRPLFKM